MLICPYGRRLLLLIISALTPTIASAAEPTAPPGPLTEVEQAAFRDELQPLEQRLAALRKAPGMSPDRWADAAIFTKALAWALDFGPPTDPNSRALIRLGLDRAHERIDALADGKHPWTTRHGHMARGFISAVDDSPQPYCLVVPGSYDPAKPTRLDVVLHGSTNATGIGELLWVANSDSGATAAPGSHYIELYPMGRLGENSYRFEGETDVEEAIAAVCRDWNIDRSRIVLRGHSLGGVGTWQLGLKRPDRYAAIGPGAGPVDTIEFSNSPWKHFVRLDPLTPWQKTMLHLVDAIDYTPNAAMVPVVAAMGDQDPYYSSHLLIEKAFAKEGIPFNGIVDHGAGHGITQAKFQEQLDRLGDFAARGADPFPKHLQFVTWTLKFSRCRWIELFGLEQHYERARIEADVAADGAISVSEPENITRFSIYAPALTDETKTVTIGGQRIAVPSSEKGFSNGVLFEKQNGRWTCRGMVEPQSLTGKRPGLQGPIDDAFSRRFLCVRGTHPAWNPRVAAWAEANLRRFADEWRRHYHGYLPVKNDTDVTDDDVRNSNLILFGDPGSNPWIAKVLPQLPLTWTRDSLELGDEKHSATDHAAELICPNPLASAAGRYVVLNSGHTYHDAELRFSYMVFPRLGDWAVMKVGDNSAQTSPPQVAETVVNSGFFNEAWTMPPAQ